MHLVFPRDLSNRFDTHQGFQSDLGFEGARIPFPFSFAHSSAVLSCPAEPEKTNLATGPNYGVHFWPDSMKTVKSDVSLARLLTCTSRVQVQARLWRVKRCCMMTSISGSLVQR